jgi:DNA modification methylase
MEKKMIDLKCGDCLELIKGIPDKSIDLVIIDPPYLLETDGAGMFGKRQIIMVERDM